MKFSVADHINFFAGYCDAVGRYYSTDQHLYGLSVRSIPDGSSIGRELDSQVVDSNKVSDITSEFETSIAKFLGADSRERLVFYLVDYFLWFDRHSDSCVCEKITLQGHKIPDAHLAYTLRVNDLHAILFFAAISEKRSNSSWD